MADNKNSMILTCACGQKMKVPAEAAGKTFKCVKCGQPVRVTGENVQPRPGAAPPPAAPATAPPAAEAPAAPTSRIGQMLIERALISSAHLDEALQVQREKGGKTLEILIDLGYLDKQKLHDFLSRQPGVAAIELSRFNIDSELVKLIPKELALENMVLPIDRLGKLLTVAMACPLDTATIAEIERITGLKVKAVLAKLDDIHAAVDKHYKSSTTGMMVATLDMFPSLMAARDDVAPGIGRLESLTVSPDLAAGLQELAANPAASAKQCAELASRDPALAAVLLRTANGAAYGMPGRVDSIPMAVALLGKDGAAAIAARAQSSTPPKRFDPAPLRERAVRCAKTAAGLANATGRAGAGAAYTAGLLHEIGRFAMGAVMPEKYARIDAKLTQSALADTEKKTFTMSHAEAGASLASRWRFPDTLYLTVRHYLEPEEAKDARDLASLVQVAATLAAAEKLAPEVLAACKGAMTHLGLDANTAIQVAQRERAA